MVPHVKLGVLMVDAVRPTAIVAPKPTSEYDVKGGTLKGLQLTLESAVALDAKVDVVGLALEPRRQPAAPQVPTRSQSWVAPQHHRHLWDRLLPTVNAVPPTATPCVETGLRVLAAPCMV